MEPAHRPALSVTSPAIATPSEDAKRQPRLCAVSGTPGMSSEAQATAHVSDQNAKGVASERFLLLSRGREMIKTSRF